VITPAIDVLTWYPFYQKADTMQGVYYGRSTAQPWRSQPASVHNKGRTAPKKKDPEKLVRKGFVEALALPF